MHLSLAWIHLHELYFLDYVQSQLGWSYDEEESLERNWVIYSDVCIVSIRTNKYTSLIGLTSMFEEDEQKMGEKGSTKISRKN